MTFSVGQIVEAIMVAVPHPHQVKNIELDDGAVRFDWRSARYRVSPSGSVDECEDGFLVGSDRAILMRSLIAPALGSIASRA